MRALRQIYDSLPSVIEIPPDLRRRHVEVVFLELEDSEVAGVAASADWPTGLYERTSGALNKPSPRLAGSVVMHDDLLAPAVPEEDWSAMQ